MFHAQDVRSISIRTIRILKERDMKRTEAMLCVALAWGTESAAAAYADHPTKPVRIVVNFATGGPSDIVARIVGQKLTEFWGQPVIVENVPGAAGAIGAARVARATPDGYTLLLSGSPPIVISPSLYQQLPFDPIRDLAPVSQVCEVPNLLAIHPSVSAKSIRELITLGRAQPGQFTFASAGSGSTSHLAGELFRVRAGIDIRHIPYQGTGATIVDLLAGRVTMTIAPIATLLPLVRDGKLRALAIASAKRSPAAPELATIAESGYPGFDASAWQGAFAPAKIPASMLRKLNLDLVRVIALPDVRARFAELGMEPVGNSPRDFEILIHSDLPKWAKVIKDSGAKPE
jgi:tripartite-type tricarboxylate transporter receptor subunit TctC